MEEKRTTPERASMAAEAPPHPEAQTSWRRRGGGHKRKSINSGGGGNSNPKRQSREKVPFQPIHMNGPLTRARLQPAVAQGELVLQSSVKSEVEAHEAAARAAEEIVRVSENWEALEAEIDADYQLVKTRGSTVHVVPIHAGWFSWNEIHPLEKRMLPSFFSGKSDKRNPEIYLEIRDWIMKKFHLDPNVNFEQKHLSELSVGELDARQEVMEFLDYWGLINYHPFPQNESCATHVESDVDETQKRESLVDKLYKFETVESWSPVVPRMDARAATSSGFFSESVIADELVKSEGPSVEYHCNSCSADCSRKRYHCQKQADFDLCAECFNNGKFGSNMSPSDFILMEPAEAGGASGGNWTDQETLLLLEAIELFRDNWSEIAEHVATKTKAQCILHFVEMPIEDTFFNHDNESDTALKENGLLVPTSIEDSSANKLDEGENTADRDVPEKIESVTVDQTSSCLIEISKEDEVSGSDGGNDVTDSSALKALKEAFEVVGSLPSHGERLSFAEASNPVMTLAAYLVRLVEPSIATASSRSLLKSLSSYHSSSILAARNCFRLENPPNDEKKIADSEGGPSDLEAKKDEDEHVQKENRDTCEAVINKGTSQDGKNEEFIHEDMKDSSEDQKPEISSIDCKDRSNGVKEPDEIGIDDPQPQPTSTSEPSTSDMPKGQTSKSVEEPVVPPSHSQLQTNTVKEPENGASPSQLIDPLKDEEMATNTEEKQTEPLTLSNSIAGKEDNAGAIIKDKECDTEKKETLATKNDVQGDKLKRVAVSALSAAAVKAKLLAEQEEDQIRQLATFLIDKQLQKLESKLAFFHDIENVVLRVKEQLDRSKNKLFHERAQIIAARLGMTASARPNSQLALPHSAATATALPNQGSRPVMCTNSLRPPIARPGMAPNTTTSNFVPATASGTSVQPSYSVGTK